MKCPKCGTEGIGNTCIKCGNNLNSFKKSFLKDENLKSIMDMTKKILEDNKESVEKIDKNKMEFPSISDDINKKEILLEKSVMEVPRLEGAAQLETNNDFEEFKPSLKEETIDEASILSSNVDNNLVEDNNETINNSQNSVVNNKDENLEFPVLDVNNIQDNNLFKTDISDENLNIPSETINNSHDEEFINKEMESVTFPIVEEEKEPLNNTEIVPEETNYVEFKDIELNNEVQQMLDEHLGNNVSREQSNLEIFIGKNYDKILNKKFNIIPALLGEIWLLYRKCFLAGILLGILNYIFILYVLFLTDTSIYIYIIVRLVLFFIISKNIYIRHASKKVKLIENKYSNNSNEELTDKIRKTGGTILIAPIIYILVITIITLLGFYWIYNLGTYKFYNLSVRGNGWILNNNDGLIYGDTEKTCIVDISYGTKIDDNIMAKLYEKGIINEEQYTNKLEYDFSLLEKENINGVDWFKLTSINENNIFEDILVTMHNDVVYFVNFKGNKPDDYGLCQEKFIDLKNSFKVN